MDLTDGSVRRPENPLSSSLYRRVLTDTVTNQKVSWKNARERVFIWSEKRDDYDAMSFS